MIYSIGMKIYKAIILLGTLKSKGLSNTQVLSEFFAGKAQAKGVETEIIKLVDHKIFAGTYTDMGEGDQWPEIYKKIIEADFIIFATPIWWNNQSSEMQRVIERLDEVHDGIMSSGKSALDGKVGGIIVTGDSDGAQNVIGNISNFFNAVGITLPAYATLTVLSEIQSKGKDTGRDKLLEMYEKDYSKTAETMVEKMIEQKH